MVSHPETGSDSPIGSDRESGCDKNPKKKIIRNFQKLKNDNNNNKFP